VKHGGSAAGAPLDNTVAALSLMNSLEPKESVSVEAIMIHTRVGVMALLAVLTAGAWAHGEDTPNLLMLKTDLLVVTAHPDDETMMGATMARYADEGKVVALAVCTRGEGGGNGTGRESGVALGLVRETELRRCLAMLGVRHLHFLNRPDWGYTESVQATLKKWSREESLRRLVRVVRLLRPEVVCTMDPAPMGGQHGHHQAAGRLATEAFDAAADPDAFPEQIRDEGLRPWRIRKLYWTSFAGPSTVRIATEGKTRGSLALSAPNKTYADVAVEAARSHRSQGFDKFLAAMAKTPGGPPPRPNGFLLVKSRVLVNPREEKDLFDGIIGRKFDGPNARDDVLAAGLAPASGEPALIARLQPRAQIVEYREWLQSNGLTRLLTRLPMRATVIQGHAENTVPVEIVNQSNERRTGTVSLLVPEGWKLQKAELSYDVPAHGRSLVTFQCAVPGEAAVKGHDASVKLGGAVEIGQLDVVPAVSVKRFNAEWPVDAVIAKWENARIEAIPISSANIVQGKVAGPQECSGRFFVRYDEAGIQVLVDVTDDTVCRNIAPDDIKAHWRSTSVEICIDSAPPSENTFSTLKLGIFPGDTNGQVRAARDADANPGELGRIHSRIRIASRGTPTGYIIETHLPWAEVGMSKPDSGRKLGFNIILYHAGKKDARVGEDVGKARLAWSFWPSVQGRPEVWGAAILK
jgi:LmbE family N-acetylglucosaminyl deacetylase